MTVVSRVLKRAAIGFPVRWDVTRPFRAWPNERQLGGYYVRWDGGDGTFGEDWDRSRRDAGVIRDGPGDSYHPIRIAQYALEAYSKWSETGDGAWRNDFLNHALWLRDNQHSRDGINGCYPFPFAWPRYAAPKGFLSAMMQGEAISVLLRAFDETHDPLYVSAAETAAEALCRDIDRGGTASIREGDVYLEEAAVHPATHILNGWIFALWGLFELQSRVVSTQVSQTYRSSLATLVRSLPFYDSGDWSYYSLDGIGGFRKLATLKYHCFHIAQLNVLYSMTGEPLFQSTAQRWQAYIRSSKSRAAVWLNALASLPTRMR